MIMAKKLERRKRRKDTSHRDVMENEAAPPSEPQHPPQQPQTPPRNGHHAHGRTSPPNASYAAKPPPDERHHEYNTPEKHYTGDMVRYLMTSLSVRSRCCVWPNHSRQQSFCVPKPTAVAVAITRKKQRQFPTIAGERFLNGYGVWWTVGRGLVRSYRLNLVEEFIF